MRVTAENGYLHCGPNGAGHFVKMVHNGVEYGMMAAYAEGLNVLNNANVGKSGRHRGERRDRAPARPQYYQYDIDMTGGRRGLAPRTRRRLVAPRPDGALPSPSRPPRGLRRPRLRLR